MRMLPNVFLFQNHASAWPFMKAVEITDAPDYYQHIKYPMGRYNTSGAYQLSVNSSLRLHPPGVSIRVANNNSISCT